LEKSVTKEEVIAAMKESAATLGHAPSFPELRKLTQVILWDIRKNFGTYGRALQACGMQRHGGGYKLDMRALFVDWAEATRSLRKPPTMFEYEEQGKTSCRALMRRCGGWSNVPIRMLEYARQEGLKEEWSDVLDITATYLQYPASRGRPSSLPTRMPTRPKIMVDQPMYGAPLLTSPLTCAPINELGVVFLFGALAQQLGFAVIRIQPDFPDCEALRRVERERWQKSLIEFELESRNFQVHEHRVEDCDLIVCWNHNWPDCPLEVLELKSVVGRLQPDVGMMSSLPQTGTDQG
jgi:HNH endonuclease